MRSFEDKGRRSSFHPSSSSSRLILPTLRNIVGEDKKQAVGGKLRSIKRSSAAFCDGRRSTSFWTSLIVSPILWPEQGVCSRLFVFVQRQISTVCSGCALETDIFVAREKVTWLKLWGEERKRRWKQGPRKWNGRRKMIGLFGVESG